VSEKRDIWDIFSETQLLELDTAATQLARTVWIYYSALKEQGFGDLQAIQLCQQFQEGLFGLNRT
jgi:hypothetical protein